MLEFSWLSIEDITYGVTYVQ